MSQDKTTEAKVSKSETTVRDRLHWEADDYGRPGRALYFMSLFAGVVDDFDSPRWRAWASTTPDGNLIGKFDTEAQAKAALEAEVHRAINE